MPDLGNVFLPPPPFADADADASAPPEDPVASDAAGAEPKWSRGLRVSMSTDLGDLLVPPPSSAPESLAEGPVTGGASVDVGPESDSGRGPQLPILTGSGFAVVRRERRVGKKAGDGKTSLEDHVRAWKEKKAASGAPAWQCVLPFLNNEPRRDDSICRLCSRYVFQEKEVRCTIGNCLVAYHLRCATEKMGHTPSKPFKCPQHSCFICKQKAYWRCVRCSISAHPNCAPWPNKVVYLENQRTQAVCWRHPSDWRRAMEHADPTSDVEEAFLRLPIPYVVEEFKVDTFLKDVMENEAVPAPYVHIRRNVYLIKRKRDYAEVGVGCTSCNANSTCMEDCECRCLSVSCSRSCHCSDMCRNRPFRKEKKIKVVKTEHCGWGVVALEAMEKGDFVIEYIGEVINDALCEQRLWDIKRRGDRNFYMCELQKDFTIDATFKGNASRFLNHSCDPNCKLEKWQVEGETRVGVFASRSIKVGEPLTYDYRFVHFGPMVECYCGASNCQGYLGSKKKINAPVSIFWGCKRQRSTVVRKSK